MEWIKLEPATQWQTYGGNRRSAMWEHRDLPGVLFAAWSHDGRTFWQVATSFSMRSRNRLTRKTCQELQWQEFPTRQEALQAAWAVWQLGEQSAAG